MARNPRLTIADVDPNAQQLVQGIAAQPGQGRATVARAVDMRRQSAQGEVEGAFDQALGQTPNVKALLDGLKATAKANAERGFGQALQNAQPVNVQPVLDLIDQMVPPNVASQTWLHGPVERELLRLRAELSNGRSVQVDANRLHQLQSRLRRDAETLSAGQGAERLAGGRLKGVRQALIDQIDEAAGGAYRPAQRQFADDMAVEDAFNKGVDTFRNRPGSAGLEDRPEFLQDWMQNASAAEQDALRQGVRVAADHVISSTRNAVRRGATLTDVDFNLDKLRIVLGDQEANRLAGLLSDVTQMGATNTALTGGSQTAARLLAQQRTNVPSVASGHATGFGTAAGLSGAMGGDPLWTAGLAGLAGAGLAKRAVGRQSAMTRNAIMAEALLASGPERDAAMAALRSGPARRQAMTAQTERMLRALMETDNRTAVPGLMNNWQTGRTF